MLFAELIKWKPKSTHLPSPIAVNVKHCSVQLAHTAFMWNNILLNLGSSTICVSSRPIAELEQLCDDQLTIIGPTKPPMFASQCFMSKTNGADSVRKVSNGYELNLRMTVRRLHDRCIKVYSSANSQTRYFYRSGMYGV